MVYIAYLIGAIFLFLSVTVLYRVLSRGLSRSAKGQQLTRFGIASLLAVLPFVIAGHVRWNVPLTLIAVVSGLWMIVFPLLDYVANRRNRAEIDNRMDFAFGLYLFGFLSGAYLGLSAVFPSWSALTGCVFAAVELPLLILAAFQVAYFAIYHASVDHDGLKLVLDTDVNEVLEFLRSFPGWAVIGGLVMLILSVMGCFYFNIVDASPVGGLNWSRRLGEMTYCLGMGWMMFRGSHSPFRRSGLPRLYFEDREHARECAGYADACSRRMEGLKIFSSIFSAVGEGSGAPDGTARRGRTYILVIGESASRDYMEAFTGRPADDGTTPWLSRMAAGGDAILFRNAYSCHFQTVPTLTRALTEMNQYNRKGFVDAVSVVDVAHALGLKVYWFSNQGHIGANDTPVTLVAETADRASWTSQTVSRRNYDGELPPFLDEVDPVADKLIVFHLIGSHFTYSNRYPASEEHFTPQGDDADGYVAAYRNSLRYTDKVLCEIHRRASEGLNLQWMVYCSDHADMPDRRRSPVFDGFGKLRIPLAVVPGADYAVKHPGLVSALKENSCRPFSNDLLFDLLCGLWDVGSDVAPRNMSVASPSYSLEASSTKVLLGEATVADDPNYAS